MDVSVCVLVVLAMVFSGASATYDCRRLDAGCLNGGACDATSGVCTCINSFRGHDCGAASASCTGTNNCQNGATCYTDAGTDKCLCAPDFIGTTCIVKRYKLVCDYINSQMVITISPHITGTGTTFTGAIYGFNKKTTCPFTAGAVKNVAHTGDTNCGVATETGTGVTRQFVRQFLVQYDPNAVMPTDELVTFTCGDTADVTVADGGVVVANIAGGLVPVTQNLKIENGDVAISRSPSTSSVDFSTDIVVKLMLTASATTKQFQDLNIISCTGQETANSPTVQFEIIKDYCPVVKAYGVLKKDGNGQFITRTTVGQRTFTMKAFMPTSTTEIFTNLVISCSVIVCPNLDECLASLHTCTPGSIEANGRKKRQAGTKEEHLNLTISITNPMMDTQATKQPLDDNACYQTWEMNVTLAVLGVGLVLVLVVCLVLAVKVILHRKSETAMGKC